MHAVELAGLASVLVANARSLLACGQRPSRQVLQEYWLCCRFLHENWCHRLAEHRRAIQDGGTSLRTRRWHEIQPLIQEVFMVEPLTRVLAYVARLCDGNEKCESDESFPMAANALAIHLEARHRCLHLIVFGQGLPVELAVRLNRVRRGVEDFSDRLLAALPKLGDLEPFCFDSPSVRELQNSLEWPHDDRSLPVYLRLLACSLQRNLAYDLDHRVVSPRLNRRTHQAALGWLPPGMFDDLGVSRSADACRYQKPGLESTGRSGDLLAPLETPLNLLMANHRQSSVDHRSPGPRW